MKTDAQRDLERFVCWVNCWANLDAHRDTVTPEWRDGYEEAVMEVLERVKPLAPDWLDTWRAEFVRRNVEPAA